ncbi:MAG: ATP-binding protein [Desulfuromonadales bacterium]
MNDDSIKTSNTGNTGQKNLAEEILDTLWEPLLVLEDDLRVKSANDAFYHHFKVEPAETVGRQVYDLGNGQWDIPLLRELLEEVLPKETILTNFEIQHTFEQIGQRTLLLKARRIDHLELILLAMEDITVRKENEALRAAKTVAEEANRAKSEFMANMNHEFRTPMTVFLAALELLQQLDRDPERRQILGMADQSARHLRTLLDTILDFSSIEARGVKIKEEPFNLQDCVQNAVQMVSARAQVKNLQLITEISSTIPALVVGDPGRLEKVLVNLIDNAIKYTAEGDVHVSVRSCSDFVEFSVSDTGIGVPEEKREVIFQHFSQADGSFTRRHGGIGLGLTISQRLVDLMGGGRIGLRARPGGGSVFFFTLPLKTATSDRTSLAVASAETTAALPSSPFILLAEDEPMVRNMIQTILTHCGWRSEPADTGREAVQKWEEGNFDLILMDLQMPEMNGLEATRKIRETEEGKKVCIFGLTGHTRPEIMEECLAAGMDRVLTKPVQIKELCSAIDSCFAVSRTSLSSSG